MKGWHMYSKIQAMKEQGFSIRQVSKIIRVSRNTIKKYWEMKPEEYAERYTAINRMTALMAYEQTVIKWLETYPCMTASQVRDWLEEKYQLDAVDRTVRRFVAKIRERYGITRNMEAKREYEAVEELPKGYQLQLDFGEKTARYAHTSRYIKLYFAVFTLTYSRNKWGIFRERPFLSTDLIEALYGCFDYFGGMPKQLVYDQDSIIVVSENGGDIIHTQAFTTFLAEVKIEIRCCRKSDPETKGLIEASVKFVKGNFMENRLYTGIDAWNHAFEEWLARVSKRKHGTTKRRPAEMFSEEQEYLLPLYGKAPVNIEEDMDRVVRRDNTVWYKSNRYSVPFGTYNKSKEVFLSVDGNKLHIITRAGDTLATHEINEEKGRLIKQEGHGQNKGERNKKLCEKAILILGEEFREYLEMICERKPRYVKDQLEIVLTACETYSREKVLAAMRYCQSLELYSANDLRDAAGATGVERAQAPPGQLPINDERCHIAVEKRALSAYADVAAGKAAGQ